MLLNGHYGAHHYVPGAAKEGVAGGSRELEKKAGAVPPARAKPRRGLKSMATSSRTSGNALVAVVGYICIYTYVYMCVCAYVYIYRESYIDI